MDLKKLFEAISKCDSVKSMDASTVAIHIAEQYEISMSIRHSIRDLKTAEEELNREYEGRRDIIRGQMQDKKNVCKHWATTYHPDPSGNNDSETTCDICGVEL